MIREDIEGITEGDKFLCVRNAYYPNTSNAIFKEGEIYTSYMNGRIIDEEGNKYHTFTKYYWEKYLIKINKRYDNHCEGIGEILNEIRLMKKYGYAYNFKTKEYIKVK